MLTSMVTFLELVHVLVAVLVTGPLVIAPVLGLRALQDRQPDHVKLAARFTTIAALASVATLLTGLLVVAVSGKWALSTGWITASLLMFIVALVLPVIVTAPALTKAAKLLTERSPASAPHTDRPHRPDDRPATGQPEQTAIRHDGDSEAISRLIGRIAVTSGITAALIGIVTALMVIRPFE